MIILPKKKRYATYVIHPLSTHPFEPKDWECRNNQADSSTRQSSPYYPTPPQHTSFESHLHTPPSYAESHPSQSPTHLPEPKESAVAPAKLRVEMPMQ